jgi:hypothetical protein
MFPNEFLKATLQEDLVGGPVLIRSEYCTSANSVHHLFHLARFMQRTGCRPKDVRTVMEWGGGYGNLAKILSRTWKLYGEDVTYIVVDHPIMSCLQWLYLSTVFGEDETRLVLKEGDFLKGRINILPTSLVSRSIGNIDLFISTWGLSESSILAQRFVASEKFFGAKRLLLAYQLYSKYFPESAMVQRVVNETFDSSKKIIESVPYTRDNYYLFV